MTRIRLSFGSVLFMAFSVACLVGCGGSDDGSTTASNQSLASAGNSSGAPGASGNNSGSSSPSAPAGGGGEEAGSSEEMEGYGSEEDPSSSFDSSYNEGYGSEEEENSEEMEGYEDPSSSFNASYNFDGGYGSEENEADSGYEEAMMEGYGESGYGESGYGDESSGYGESGYGGAGGGYGGSGMGGGANPNMVLQFIGQNCSKCHGAIQAKGDVRLNALTADLTDGANAELWGQVLEQLEGGTMPPESVKRRPSESQQQAVIAWIQQEMEYIESLDPVKDADYLAKARYAFGIGKEKEAVDYLFAHAVTSEEEESKKILSESRWFGLGPRPATTVRFATGVILKAPPNLTDVKPIGSPQLAGGGGGGGGYGGGGYGSEGYGPAGGNDAGERGRSFYELTGDVGEALVSAFESRWSAGELGSLFSDVVAIEPPKPDRRRGGGMAGGYGGGFGSGYGGESGDGGYGDGYGDGGYGDGGYGGGPGGGAAEKRKTIKAGKVVTPGLVYLGTGSQSELLKKAVEQGVDAVFVFDVEAKQNRLTQLINNETRLRLMTVAGKAIGATGRLKNVELERAQLRGAGDDDVQRNIDRLFAQFDKEVKLTDMPAMKPEHAKSRIRQLLVDQETSTLSKLFEARLFNSMGLITHEELSKVYQIALQGNEGEALANGSAEDRKLVVDAILPSYK